ncbi:protein kinase [Arenimonas sp.]|uniref:serine/threonine-protein kinase n=1 Tax=Arenimonas sp. TaxID=1872635 RepID=UPI0035AF832A
MAGAGDDTDSKLWQDAIALFERLRDLDDDQAAAALEAASPAVRDRVRRMQKAEAGTGPLDQRLPDAHTPEQLGRWRIGAVLGRGGMSVVYRARSSVAPEDQVAAVKLLALPTPSDEARARFAREIQILARLRHPGIAPLFDAGVAPDGRPWFAMALVDGEAIDAWSARTRPDTRDIVGRVAAVADAVAHAHRHLVVHRDIKPGNVMVDAEGRVVLLDFGISRVLEEGVSELTSGGSYPLTPRYAAPEQRRGGPVSTATDVYGLGALLHTLLLRAPPVLPDSADTAVLPGDCRLPADLQAVLRQALAREPGQRYAGAAELAADLRAWLDGKPVKARRGGSGYRLRRWIRRHPLPAALAAALVASIAVGVGTSLWQAGEARTQANAAREAQAEAETARARAEAVRDYVAEMLAASNPSLGREATAADLLDAGEARVDAALEAGQPEVATDLLRLIAGARTTRGEYDVAAELFERGLALAERTPGIDPRLHWTLMADYSEALRPVGKNRRAVDLATDALAMARRHGADEHELILLTLELATTESAAGDNEQALARMEPLRERFREDDLRGSQTHLRYLELLSTVNALLRKPDDRELFEERLDVAARVYANNPGWLAFTYADAVPTLRRWPDYPRAQELADAAVKVADENYTEPHVIAAIAYCNAAGLALDRGRREEAMELLDRTITIDAALKRVHAHALSCLLHRAELRGLAGDVPGALADVAAAETMRVALGEGPESRWRATGCAYAMRAHLVAGDPDGARAARAACRDAAGNESLLEMADAELALLEGKPGLAAQLLPAPPGDAPEPIAPIWLRNWRLRLALLDATDPAAAAELRPAVLAAVEAMPGPWKNRELVQDCLARPGAALSCPGAL